jgi:hypothetical protein
MANVRQLSFSGGEISPSLYGRVDQVKYATGLKTCRNFMVQRHGGVANRPGTGFVAEVKDSSKAITFIPFVFNASQTYVLEFGDLYMRVIQNGVLLTETAQNITAITQADPCVVTIAGHGYSNGNEVAAADIGGMTELNNRNFKVANAAANTFELQYMDGTDVDSTGFGAYTSGGTAAKVYEIVTPYVEADLSELQHVQSADIVSIVHPNYAPRELARTGHIVWTLTTISFGPTITEPQNAVSDSPGTAYYYRITAVDAETGEESTAESVLAGSSTQTSTISWDTVTGAGTYNIYKYSDVYWAGWVGTGSGNSFKDDSYEPDLIDTFPFPRSEGLFSGTGNYPSAISLYQQRRIFANTDNNPEAVWTSKSALPKNFNVSTPLQDDDPVTFIMLGREVNAIKHLLDIGKLIVFTTSGEWSIAGDGAGILTPTGINPKQHTANGSGTLPPIVVDGTALYVQARGSVIRDLGFDYQTESYRGNELTIFSSHLFDNYTLVDWAYQQIPHSIVWVVRSDGILLGLTYLREHQIFGWHRHDFDGTVENVTVVPEGTEDAVYLVIKRTIDGKVVRYIERMKTRQVIDIEDSVFMDSSLSYDGTNTGATTMTLSGGTNWTYDEDLTLTASAADFVSTDVGNARHITGADGTLIRCTIKTFTSTTVVTVNPHKTVPVAMRNTAFTTWAAAVDELSGLWHLEGKNVSVFADGFVVASPNNDDYDILTVSSGTATLDKPYSVMHAGLPITADIETLNIDLPGVSSMSDKKKLINKLTMFVESSRGIWAGFDADNLREFKLRDDEGYDDPVDLTTGTIDINIKPEWNSSGKVFIRQVDPLPLSVLTILPTGYIGG